MIVFCGNIIARDCCVVRAGHMADHWDVVNIRDEKGYSTWPSKNTEESIDIALSKISTAAQQTEYFNNPVTEGEVFKEITYGKVPDLKKFQFLIIYGDPAPGENKSKNSSTKSCILMGMIGPKLYIIKPCLDRGLNAEFIDWYVQLLEYVGAKFLCIATWRTINCKTLSSSRYSNRWWVKHDVKRIFNSIFNLTKQEKLIRLHVSKPIWSL